MREKAIYILGAAAILLLARNLYMIAGFPPEIAQGVIFKIIFFHVPAAFAALAGAGVALVASILFLATKNFKYDSLAVAVTEVGLAFLAANLITGSIWGRVAWGIWWTWDARLTSALVCWLLYAGYLMLRRAIEEPTQRATFAAVFSIFAFIDVPIVVFSIKWWHSAPAAGVLGRGLLPTGLGRRVLAECHCHAAARRRDDARPPPPGRNPTRTRFSPPHGPRALTKGFRCPC
jgi:heme exporter protein C